MKCTNCGNEMRVVPEAIGMDNSGNPVYHRMAYCDSCKTKTDIDLSGSRVPMKKGESIFGIIGMIFSFIFCNILFPFVGLVLSIIGLCSKTKKSVCGTIGLIVSIVAIIFNIFAPEFLKYVDQARQNSLTLQESQNTENNQHEEDNPDNDNSPIQQEDNNKPVEENKQDNIFRKGEIAELDGVQVTLLDYRESNGSEYNTPSDGNVFMLVEFEISNNTEKEIAVSSMLSFEAYADDYTLNYSLSALMEKDGNQLDGTIAAGKKMKGWVGWEVPNDYQNVEIHFTDNVWSSNKFVFVIEK